MEFREVLKKLDNKDNLILGKKENSLVGIDINDYPSMIITGETGSGKSIFLDQIMLELISTHTSLEMGLVLIDSTGVELKKYADSRYTYFSSSGEDRREGVCLIKVSREIHRRKELFKNENVTNVIDYNNKVNNKLPLLVLPIDDNLSMLKDEDTGNMINHILKEINGLGIFFILVENDVDNDFFKSNDNLDASVLITFDQANQYQSRYVNIPNSENLGIGKFLAKIDGQIEEYEDFKFDDHIIDEILDNK